MQIAGKERTSHGWLAAFLLVIPGMTSIGAGIGLLMDRPGPWTTIGLGAGAAL